MPLLCNVRLVDGAGHGRSGVECSTCLSECNRFSRSQCLSSLSFYWIRDAYFCVSVSLCPSAARIAFQIQCNGRLRSCDIEIVINVPAYKIFE